MPDYASPVKLLSPGELAPLLGLTPDGVAAAEDAGRLPPAQRTPGNHRRFDPAAVVEHLRGRGVPVPPALEALAAGGA